MVLPTITFRSRETAAISVIKCDAGAMTLRVCSICGVSPFPFCRFATANSTCPTVSTIISIFHQIVRVDGVDFFIRGPNDAAGVLDLLDSPGVEGGREICRPCPHSGRWSVVIVALLADMYMYILSRQMVRRSLAPRQVLLSNILTTKNKRCKVDAALCMSRRRGVARCGPLCQALL